MRACRPLAGLVAVTVLLSACAAPSRPSAPAAPSGAVRTDRIDKEFDLPRLLADDRRAEAAAADRDLVSAGPRG